MNITISYSYYSTNKYLFSLKRRQHRRRSFPQIRSNLAFIVPRPRRSFGQVVSDNKIRHSNKVIISLVNIKVFENNARRIEYKKNNKGDKDYWGDIKKKKVRECNAIYTESKLWTGQLAFPEKSPFFPLESSLLNLSPRGGERVGYSHDFRIGLCLPVQSLKPWPV